MFENALDSLPFRLSQLAKNLLQKICLTLVNQTDGCLACRSGEGKKCLICDRTDKFIKIQIKHQLHLVQKKEATKTETYNDCSISTRVRDRETSNINHFKLIITGLDHLVENKSIQKLLRDLLFARFLQVKVHYVCVDVGNWDRFREQTRDRAYVVLVGSDSKEAGEYIISLFKNPVLKNIKVLSAKNQRLYPDERIGGFRSKQSQ